MVSACKDFRNSVWTLRTIEKALSQSALLWGSCCGDTVMSDDRCIASFIISHAYIMYYTPISDLIEG